MAFPFNEVNEQLVKDAELGDLEAVARLLASEADPRHGESLALRWAAHNGHAECVRLLIPVSDPKADGSAALHWAARNGHAECVQLLIPVSDPNVRDRSALCWAAENGHAECVRLLIPVSYPNARDSYALRWASANGHAECVRLLISVSDPKANDSQAIRWAAHSGHAECTRILAPASVPLTEIRELVSSVIAGKNPAVLSIMMANEPKFLDGVDVPAALATAIAGNRHELAAALRSIIERKDIDSDLWVAPSTTQNLFRL